jgi:hypothetical protein
MKSKYHFLHLLILIISAISFGAMAQEIRPEDFKSKDIGNPEMIGSCQINNGQFTIMAGGSDIWGTRDEFHYAYIEKTGDFDFSARIEGLTSTHLYTKAGLMAREDLTDNSRHVFFQAFPNNSARNKNNGGFEFQYRAERAGEMKAIYPAGTEGDPEFPVNFPYTWIRLKRQGNLFSGFTSADGQNWKQYTTFTLVLPEKLYLGLAVTSHNTGVSAKSEFSEVSVR